MLEGRNKKTAIWTEIGRFRTVSALLIQRWLKMMYNVWGSIEEVPYGFSMWCVKFKGHTGDKITDFDQNWVFPEIMQKSWRAKEEVPYSLRRYYVKFKDHTGQKLPILTAI